MLRDRRLAAGHSASATTSARLEGYFRLEWALADPLPLFN
jgi:hypothetical protein